MQPAEIESWRGKPLLVSVRAYLNPVPGSRLTTNCKRETLKQLKGTLCCAAGGGSGQAQRAAALELLRGNVQGALKAVVDADCLTADFVSLAASAGRAAWVAASKAYAARLEAEGQTLNSKP